jgi:hypothetical protein
MCFNITHIWCKNVSLERVFIIQCIILFNLFNKFSIALSLVQYLIYILIFIIFLRFLLYLGFKPVWNERLLFDIEVPELALVRFVVNDSDRYVDDFIGYYVVPVNSIVEGKCFNFIDIWTCYNYKPGFDTLYIYYRFLIHFASVIKC